MTTDDELPKWRTRWHCIAGADRSIRFACVCLGLRAEPKGQALGWRKTQWGPFWRIPLTAYASDHTGLATGVIHGAAAQKASLVSSCALEESRNYACPSLWPTCVNMRALSAFRLTPRSLFTHYYGASLFSRVSLVRWQNTQSRSKSVFYRASGFERGTTKKEVWGIIRRYLRNEEEDDAPEITVLPTCDRDDSSIAIIKFAQHRRPAFLAEVDEKPSGEKVITTKDDDGTIRHIMFDRHFHGFTQLYPTPPNTKIRAE
jgi:hypothetical protein